MKTSEHGESGTHVSAWAGAPAACEGYGASRHEYERLFGPVPAPVRQTSRDGTNRV